MPKITDLPASAGLALADLVPVVDDVAGTPATQKATFTQVRAIIVPIVLTADVSGTLPVANGGTGITSLGAGVATWLGTPSGANLASALTSALPNTKGGTGQDSSAWTGLASVSAGTWSALTLGTGVSTWLATPSGTNLASALTTSLPNTKGGTGQDSSAWTGLASVSAGTWSALALGTGVSTLLGQNATGTGGLVGLNTPTLVTPVIGAATGTSLAVSSFLSYGATVASGGGIRGANNTKHVVRNAGNTADLDVCWVSSSDNLTFWGTGASYGSVIVNNPGSFEVQDASFWQIYVTTNGLQIGAAPSFGGGQGVLGVTNARTNPSSNPTGGGVLYSNAGAGTWRGSGGTVTAFGPAEPHCPKCGTDVGISQAENDIFGEELINCRSCEIRTGNGVVLHVADFFERRKAA